MNNCFDNEFATVKFDQDKNALLLTWHRFAKKEDFRETMIKFYDISQEKNITKWFFDSRKQGLISPEDQMWTVSEIMNRDLDTAAIKTAVVMSESLFLEVSVYKISKDIQEQRNAPVTSENFQQFTKPEEALAWLNL